MEVRKIGIVGSGFIARGLVMALERHPDLSVSRVLTRRDLAQCPEFPRPGLLTNSLQELIDHSELCVECSGDPIHGTEVLAHVLAASLPVVTMDAELQVTTGSYLTCLGRISEGEGDQPGSLAALRENVLQMGFRPLVYGNIKGFLNLTPAREEMEFWARKQGIRLPQVTAFTDGTKVQIEQALVANGLGAEIAAPGLLGVPCEDLQTGARVLADFATCLESPISDYVLSPQSPPGVFIVAEHAEYQQSYLRYLKMGEGPYYVILQPHHLCHLELAKTIRRLLEGGPILLNNGPGPVASVAAVAKVPLQPGDYIERAIGSFELRGVAIRIDDEPEHVPIGLLAGARVVRPVEPGEMVHFDAVELPATRALQAWSETLAQRLAGPPRPRPAVTPQDARPVANAPAVGV